MNIIEILKDFYRKITKKDVDKLPVFYINGSQTLPPPLSAEAVLQRLWAGWAGPCCGSGLL